MQQHVKKCSGSTCNDSSKNNEQQPTISGFFSVKTKLSKGLQGKVNDTCCSFIAKDLRPTSATEGSGLNELLQVCVEVGAKNGNISVDDFIPSRFTVKRKNKIDEKAGSIKEVLSKDVVAAVKSNGLIGLTTDLWTDVKRRHFLSLTSHYVINSELCAKVLTVYEFGEVWTEYPKQFC